MLYIFPFFLSNVDCLHSYGCIPQAKQLFSYSKEPEKARTTNCSANFWKPQGLSIQHDKLYSKLANSKVCAFWDDQFLPDCCHNPSDKVDCGKTSEYLCLSLQVWVEMYKCTFNTKHNNLESVKLAWKEIISFGSRHISANTEIKRSCCFCIQYSDCAPVPIRIQLSFKWRWKEQAEKGNCSFIF